MSTAMIVSLYITHVKTDITEEERATVISYIGKLVTNCTAYLPLLFTVFQPTELA